MRPPTIVIMLLLALTPIILAQEEPIDYFLPENILRFADSLYQEGDYLRAAAEYQRYLYRFDVLPPDADHIFYRIGLCFEKGKDYKRSITYFQKIIDLYPESERVSEAYYEIAYSYFLMKEFDKSTDHLSAPLAFRPNKETTLRIYHLRGLNYLYQKQWAQAGAYLNTIEPEARDNDLTRALINLANEGQTTPRKSPVLGGLLSAVLPGAGKIYSHRTADGFVSLLTVGMTAWQAYDGFHKDGLRSAKGWIYGALSAFFYIGNIYGSVVSVNLYNQSLENAILDKISVTIHVEF